MFEIRRRGRQARNSKTNAPKILDLKSSSEQIIFRKLPLGAPDLLITGMITEAELGTRTLDARDVSCAVFGQVLKSRSCLRPTKLLVTREKKSLVPRLGDTKFCCQLIINITNFYVFKK